MMDLSILRFPSVPLSGLAPLQSSELGELLALAQDLPANGFAPAKVGACGEEAGVARCAKDLADRQGDKQQLNGSPRSYLEAVPLSSRATNSSRVPSAGSYSAADWASSKGEGDEEGDEEHGSELLDSSADDEHGVTLRRSGRNHRTDAKRAVTGEKRKVGRPIIYCGDPDAPDLTPQERRRIRRRIANRESARRVRARRQDLLEDMAVKAREMEEYNASLMQRAESVEEKHERMMAEVAAINESLRQKCKENEALQAELDSMKAALLAAAGDKATSAKAAAAKEEGSAADVAPFQSSGQALMGPPAAPQGVAPMPLPNAVISSGFAGSPFGVAASLCAPDMQLACASRGGAKVPAVTTGQQHLLTSNTGCPAAQAGQVGVPYPSALRAPSIEPAALTLSLDRSLSEFLNEVVCF